MNRFAGVSGAVFSFLVPGIVLLVLSILLPGLPERWHPSIAAGSAFIALYMIVRGFQLSGSRKRMERLYLEYDRRYRSLVDLTADGFVLVLDDGRILADLTLYALTGRDPALPLPSIGELVAGDEDGMELMDYIRRRDPDITGLYETALVCRDGGRTDVVISASRIATPELTGFVLILKDMRGEKRSEHLHLQLSRDTQLLEMQTALLFFEQPVTEVAVPPLVLPPDTGSIEAAGRMREAGVNALIVADDPSDPLGIVTDQDFRDRVILAGRSPDVRIGDIMSSPLISIPGETLLFEAFHAMRERGLYQVGVLDAEGLPAGLVTLRRLMEIQGYSPFPLFESLKKAPGVEELKAGYRKLPGAISTLVKLKASGSAIARLVSRVGAIIRQRIIELTIGELGPPPVRFLFLSLGSEGRGEQTLLTDQDNALLYEEPPEHMESAAADYFLKFGSGVCDRLDEVGYTHCPGGVMASNPKWCRPESVWRDYFRDWIHPARADGRRAPGTNLLEVSVFFDFRPAWGSPVLARRLRGHISQTLAADAGSFFMAMADMASRYRPPLTPFGNIQVDITDEEDPVFDIKKALLPLVVYVRTFALRAGLEEIGTLERIAELHRLGVFGETRRLELDHAFDYLLALRFRDQIETLDANEQMDNLIYVDELLEIEKVTLKEIFSLIIALQNELRYEFTGTLR